MRDWRGERKSTRPASRVTTGRAKGAAAFPRLHSLRVHGQAARLARAVDARNTAARFHVKRRRTISGYRSTAGKNGDTTATVRSARVSLVPHTPPSVPDFTRWPSFPFEGNFRVKPLHEPVPLEPPRKGEDGAECAACTAPDEAYIWVSERWRVRAMDRPSGLPVVLILEARSHFDLGDLPNMLAAELGVMTVRLERAIRSLDGVARVHVNRWGDGSAHLHMWFLARPYGRLQLRGTFLALWNDILPPVSEAKWRENLALVAAWLADFGGRPLAEPPRIAWQAPSSFTLAERSGTSDAATSDAATSDAATSGPSTGDPGASPAAISDAGTSPPGSDGGEVDSRSVARVEAGPEEIGETNPGAGRTSTTEVDRGPATKPAATKPAATNKDPSVAVPQAG
jgi:hypothetical protein